MSYDPQSHHRRSIRLKGYDYSLAGVYFVTMVSHQCATLFGDVVAGEVQLNAIGRIIESAWLALEDRFPKIALDEFVIMPDHMHAIIFIVGATPVGVNSVGATTRVAPTDTPAVKLGDVIGAFKSIATHDIIVAVRRGDLPPFAGKIWQRNYYEHIIRNEKELAQIRQYTRGNPLRWPDDAQL